MVVFRFSLEDLARTRFAVSPMNEVTASLRVLRDPARAAGHVRWVRGLRGRLGDVDLSAALRLVARRGGYTPDFLSPPPSGPLAEIGEELAVMRAVAPDQVRREVRMALGDRPAPAALEPFLRDPEAAIERLAGDLEAYWERAIAPHWARIRRLLDGDLAHRARRLTEGGPAALFADLHPAVRWRGDRVEVEHSYSREVELEGQGLLLVPSAFTGPQPAVMTEPEFWQPTLIYPARGVGLLWDAGAEHSPEALAHVLGRTRARILAALDAPRSTTDLADALAVTPSGASQHLTALRDAGLVAGRREGRTVLYARTPAADALVEAAGEPL